MNNVPDPDPWWTLEPSENLREWESLLEKDLECDWYSTTQWLQVLHKGPMGRLEALRILHHMVKDKKAYASGPWGA